MQIKTWILKIGTFLAYLKIDLFGKSPTPLFYDAKPSYALRQAFTLFAILFHQKASQKFGVEQKMALRQTYMKSTFGNKIFIVFYKCTFNIKI